MALYALQTAYAPVGWAALLKDPQNRMEAVKPVVQRLGGSVVDGWLTFGDYDVLVICQLPDNVSATALSMAISAGGAVRSVKTTPLVTFDEGLMLSRRPRTQDTRRRQAKSRTLACIAARDASTSSEPQLESKDSFKSEEASYGDAAR